VIPRYNIKRIKGRLEGNTGWSTYVPPVFERQLLGEYWIARTDSARQYRDNPIRLFEQNRILADFPASFDADVEYTVDFPFVITREPTSGNVMHWVLVTDKKADRDRASQWAPFEITGADYLKANKYWSRVLEIWDNTKGDLEIMITGQYTGRRLK
jgi:hypothetical protein